MRAVSKTRQLQRMLEKAMRRSPWRAGNHGGALSQRSFYDCSCEHTKASSCTERKATCLFQHTTHSSQRSIKSCVFSTTLNTLHVGIQKNVPCSVHSRGVKNKLQRPKKGASTSQRNLSGCQCETVSNSGFYFLAKSMRNILVDPFLYTDSQEMAKTRKCLVLL